MLDFEDRPLTAAGMNIRATLMAGEASAWYGRPPAAGMNIRATVMAERHWCCASVSRRAG